MSIASPPPARALLQWYDRHRRQLPWRAPPGAAADPYRVWLSEIMLQQTTVAAVIPYFDRFTARFPSLDALAQAPEEAVLAAWAGLGYYARARNLHACARAVLAGAGGSPGQFPASVAALAALPGIGAYTARAIAAIGFNQPVVPVDGNVERVAARIAAITAPLPRAKPAIAAAAAALGEEPLARGRPADFAQALFDLGATICTPRPVCGLCPWHDHCAARRAGIAAELPRKAPKPERPQRYGAHFLLADAAGSVLLRRRPRQGLLGGMTEFPGTEWQASRWTEAEALAAAAAIGATPLTGWRRAGEVRHGFTHFRLTIDIYVARPAAIPPAALEPDGFLRPLAALAGEALPSLMRKCLRAGADALSAPGVEPAAPASVSGSNEQRLGDI